MLNRLHPQKGILLIDALIALLILAVGELALLRLESNLVANNILSQMRADASFLASQLISTAYADMGNAACYTVPVNAQVGCTNNASSNFTAGWVNEVTSAFPGTAANPPTAVLNADGSLTVTIYWQRAQGALHNFTMTGQVQ